MKQYFQLIPCTILLAATALVTSSCNTFIGFGRDIEGLGSGMQNKAHGKDWASEGGTNVQPAPAPAQTPSQNPTP
jgi:predicted small secreted protein